MAQEEAVAEKPAEEKVQMVFGEVHIIVDRETGAIGVSAPNTNIIVALGLLDAAKDILKSQRPRPSPIKLATPGDMPKGKMS